MFNTPLPIVLNILAEVITEFKGLQLLNNLKGVQWTHKHVWPKLHVLCETGVIEPHYKSPNCKPVCS